MRKSPEWYLCISIQPPLFFLFPLIFVYCGKFIHNIKIIINHFSVFNLVILNTFITLCNHDHCLSPQLFLSCETEAPCSLNNNSPFLPPSSPSTTILLFVSKIFFFWSGCLLGDTLAGQRDWGPRRKPKYGAAGSATRKDGICPLSSTQHSQLYDLAQIP